MAMPASRSMTILIILCSLSTCLVMTLFPGHARALKRSGQTTFYDPGRDEIYVFGGRDAPKHLTNDMFMLRRGESPPRWRHVQVAGERPPARESAAGVYCPSRREFIIFGGLIPKEGGGGLVALGDTWRLRMDPEPRWDRIATDSPGPAPRYEHTAVYDSKNDRMIVQGGGDPGNLDDTWELTLSGTPVWKRLEIPDPKPADLYGHVAVYDQRHHQMVVFGGSKSDGNVWFLSLSGEPRWSSCTVDSVGRPGVMRSGSAADFDSVDNSVISFGGTGISRSAADLWTVQTGFSEERWSPGPYQPLCNAREAFRADPGVMAPDHRTNGSIVVLPHKRWLEAGEGQPVLLIFGGQRVDVSHGWTIYPEPLSDCWMLIERRPGPGQGTRWWSDWQSLTVEDETVQPTNVTSSGTTGPPVDIRPNLNPVHQRVLNRWLRQHPALRLMTLEDAKLTGESAAAMQRGYGSEYHPCYVVGDFNEDRAKDFAVLLIDTAMRSKQGTIAIFNGPFPNVAHGPAFLDSGYSVPNWGMWCDFKPRIRLYEGAFESDNFTWFIWKNGKYVQEAPSLD